MTNQKQPHTTQDSNEIDLGQLFDLIKKGFNNLFKKVLRIFVYLKKNLIKLAVLILLGVGIGFLMNNLIPKKLKAEILVKSNFESKDYLYATVDEIASNIRSKDTLFFKNMGIEAVDLDNFGVKIEPIEEEEVDKELIEQNNKYLEILQNYQNDEFILGIVKSEILKNTSPIHRITFTYKNAQKGEEYTRKMMNYINSNPYFKGLQEVFIKNAADRIEKNKDLIKQIDGLVASYSQNLANREGATSQTQGMVLFDNENSLNIPNLLGLKNKLIKEIEKKHVEMLELTNAVSIQNFGKTQAVQKSLFGTNLVLFPAILIGAFFIISIIKYLNKKARELL